MIDFTETKEKITIQGDKLKIEISQLTRKVKISSLITNFSLDRIEPAINLLINNKIITLLPVGRSTNSVIETLILDELGIGKQFLINLVFNNTHDKKNITIEAQLAIILYEDSDFCILKLIIPKEASKFLNYSLHSLAPLRITDGTIILNEENKTHPEKITFFEQGFQSWSYTKTRLFNEAFEPIFIDVFASINQNKDSIITGRYISEFITAISDIESKGSLIIGFCTLADAYSRIVMDHLIGPSKISWLTAYSQFDGIPINQLKKQPVCSEELFISFEPRFQGYLGLIKYAEVTGKKMNVTIHQPKVGWCSWYYYYTNISNKELLSNVKYFKQSPEISVDMLQLDDGYFTAIGDYTSFNDKFSNGLSDFVTLTHEQGKTAGLWIAPFFAAENSEIYSKHPEWFLKSVIDNEPLPVCYNWDQTEYALDLTNSEVQNHIKTLIQTIIDEWHFDFIKIDFLYAASVFESDYLVKGLTRAQIYRKGLEIIRQKMGKEKYLLGCGAPLGPSIGLVDAMRISEDTKELWDTGENPIYGYPCLKYALIGSINRSFMHNNFWVNDPDCLILRKKESELTFEEVKLQCTIFGLTGGQLLLSDDMTRLEEDRLRLALKLMPPYAESAIPIDTLYESFPIHYLLETETEIGSRALLAVINWNNEVVNRNLVLKDILTASMGSSSQFLVFDWWQEALLGCFSYEDSIIPLEIPPHGCRYLGIIPYEDSTLPLLLSSTLHITQGCKEIKKLKISSNSIELGLNQRGLHTGELFFLFPQNTKEISAEYPMAKQYNEWGILCRLKIRLLDQKDIKIEFKSIDKGE
ncbi:MAG: glycoside hydrolase family 36 protein [Promethearchaeota archaeon]